MSNILTFILFADDTNTNIHYRKKFDRNYITRWQWNDQSWQLVFAIEWWWWWWWWWWWGLWWTEMYYRLCWSVSVLGLLPRKIVYQ